MSVKVLQYLTDKVYDSDVFNAIYYAWNPNSNSLIFFYDAVHQKETNEDGSSRTVWLNLKRNELPILDKIQIKNTNVTSSNNESKYSDGEIQLHGGLNNNILLDFGTYSCQKCKNTIDSKIQFILTLLKSNMWKGLLKISYQFIKLTNLYILALQI